MSNFNLPDNYLQSNPQITAMLVAQAQKAIDKSPNPERYVVNVSYDSKGVASVTIQDRNRDAIFNEAMTGNMSNMRSY